MILRHAQRVAYFPDSRVASDGELVSPVSYSGDAPVPFPNDASPGMVPAGGDSPWIVPVPSDEQGVGRSPGHQWPWRVHAEAYNFDQIAVMPFEHEQTNGMPAGSGGYGETGREHTGLPGIGFMPGGAPWYGQGEQIAHELSPTDTVISTEDPQSSTYTEEPLALGLSGGGYGYE